MFRHFPSIRQKGENNNKAGAQESIGRLGKSIAKKIATVALAFSAQYGALIGTQPARAQENMSVSNVQVSGSDVAVQKRVDATEMGTLDKVDKDLYQVDPIHSVENGIAILHGAPVVMMPIIDTTDNNTPLLMMYKENGALGKEYADRVAGLSQMFPMLGDSYRTDYPGYQYFVDTAKWVEENVQMSNAEKIQHYYRMIYFWSSMSKWEWEGEGDAMKKVSIPMDQDKQDSEIARYTNLINELLNQPEYKGQPKYERMRGEVSQMKLVDLANNLSSLAQDTQTRITITQFIEEENYLQYLDKSLQTFEDTMDAFEAGDPDVTRDFLAIQRRTIQSFIIEDRAFAKIVREKNWDSVPSIKNLLAHTEKRMYSLLTRYADLIENLSDFTNKQDYSTAMTRADNALEYAEAVTHHDTAVGYDNKGQEVLIDARDIVKFEEKILERTARISEKYAMKDLLLPDMVVDQVHEVKARIDANLPGYKVISDADMAGPRLDRFVVKTATNKSGLSTLEKAELVDIFNSVLEAPNRKSAEGRLVRTMQKYLYLAPDMSKTFMRVARAEDTGLEMNFNEVVFREVNGETVSTMMQPADKLEARYTFVNDLPFDVPANIKVYYPGTQQPIQDVEVVLKAHKEAEVNVTTFLAATPAVRGRFDQNMPKYDMQIASVEVPQMLAKNEPELPAVLASLRHSMEMEQVQWMHSMSPM